MCSFCTEEYRSAEERSYITTDMKSLSLSLHGSCCTCYTCFCPKSCTGARPHTIFFPKHKLVHTGEVQCSKKTSCVLVLKSDSQEQSIFIRSLIIQALELIRLDSPLKMGKRVLSGSSTPWHFPINRHHKTASVTAHWHSQGTESQWETSQI